MTSFFIFTVSFFLTLFFYLFLTLSEEIPRGDFFIRQWRMRNFVKNDGEIRLKTGLTSAKHYFIIIVGRC